MTKALVIEDNEEVADNLVRMLGLLRVEANAAYGVREAMLLLLESPPDIVFFGHQDARVRRL